MKMSFYKTFSLAVCVILLFLTGCKQEESKQVEPELPQISLNQTACTASKHGDTLSVEYSIINPVENAVINIDVDQDWVTNIDTSIEGIIIFEVLPAEEETERTARMVISYPAEAPSTQVELLITQEAADPDPFVFENMKAEMTSYTVDVYPVDKTSPYIIFASTPIYMQINGIENDEDLFKDDIEYFISLAEYYEMSLTDLLQQLAHQGDEVGYTANEGVIPGSDYVLYAYHVNLETAERTSKIVRTYFTTQEPDQIEVDFEMSFEVNGAIVEWEVDPQGYEGYYYMDAIDMKLFNEAFKGQGDFIAYTTQYVNELMLAYLQQDYTNEQILSALCRTGKTSMRVTQFKPEMEYGFFVVAIDEQTMFVASDPDYEMVTTEAVEEVEMDIEISLLNLTPRTAEIEYLASKSEPYAANCLTKEVYDSFGETDDERVTNMMQLYALTTIFGTEVYEFTNFTPDTDYVAFAFGYNGGIRTTQIYTYSFKTPSETESGVVLTLVSEEYYDVYAVSQLDDNFYSFSVFTDAVFFPVVVDIQPQPSRYYYQVFPLSGKENFTDEEWIGELLYAGPMNSYTLNSLFSYDVPMMFVGFACDEQGLYGPLYKKELLFTREGVSDPQNYLDWFYGSFEAPRTMMVRQHDLSAMPPFRGLLQR